MYSVYLPYGEGDVVISNSTEVYLPNDENMLLVSVCGYEYAETYADSIYYKNSDGLRDGGMLSRNGDKIYFSNYNDGNTIYVYDISLGKASKIIDKQAELTCVSDDGSRIVYSSNNKMYLYTGNGMSDVELPTGIIYKFNHKGDLYIGKKGVISRYQDGVLFDVFEFTCMYDDTFNFAFDSSGNYMLVNYKYSNYQNQYDLLKENEGAFTVIGSVTTKTWYKDVYLSDDLSSFYDRQGYTVDMKTGDTGYSIGNVLYKAWDNTYIISKNYACLYNPATGEAYRIASMDGDMHYNPDPGILTAVRGGRIAKCKFSSEKSTVKYLLSFDGRHSWQSFKNGRWINASAKNLPTCEESDASGMTDDEINNISADDLKKLYTGETDILNIDVAIYMNSNSNELTPFVKDITVSTAENDGKKYIRHGEI